MRKLSKIKFNKFERYAQCPNCKEIFIDDILLYGSICCPNEKCQFRGWVLYRNIKKEELNEKCISDRA